MTQLWDNPNPSASISAWPMQHPIEASLAWTVPDPRRGGTARVTIFPAPDNRIAMT
jgi:hypothetical protein